MKDILLDATTNEILIKDGDFAIGSCELQNQKLLLICDKSSFKEFPTAGVGAASFLEKGDDGDLIREIRDQFTADGMDVKSITIDGGNLTVDARYK